MPESLRPGGSLRASKKAKLISSICRESSETRNAKGRQLHLGSFPAAEPAALCVYLLSISTLVLINNYSLAVFISKSQHIVFSKHFRLQFLHLAKEYGCRAYDRAAQKLRPWNSHLNFPDTDYSQDEFIRVRRIALSLNLSIVCAWEASSKAYVSTSISCNCAEIWPP